MSDSVHKMNLVKVIDSRLTSGRINNYGIEQGPDTAQYRISPASSISNTNINFSNINPNDQTTFMDKTVYVEVQYQVNFTGTCPVGQNLLDQWGYDVAPRALFVNNSFRSSSVIINSNPFIENTNDNLSAYTRVNFDKLKSYLSQTASVLDNSQLYSESVGSNANPLASVQNAPVGAVPPRGGFQGVQITSNTPTSASLLITGTEPVMVSPLKWDDVNDSSPAFINLNTFQCEFQLDDQLAARLISISDNATATFTNVVASVQKANLYQTFYTSQMIQQLPTVSSYPWYKVITFSRTGVSVPSRGSATMQMDLINLASIPKKLYVYLKPTRSSYNINQTDAAFARIENIKVNFGTIPVLSGTNAHSLYAISKKNGVDADFNSWYGSINTHPRNFSGAGSVLALSPLFDFGLQRLLTSGSNKNVQLQLEITYTNLNPSQAITYDAWVLCVQDGLCTLNGSGCVAQEAVVGHNDILNSSMLEPSLTTSDVYEYSGGSFFSSIGDFWNKHKSWLLPVAKIASTAVKGLYPASAPILSAVGLGMCRDCGYKCGGACGGGPSGGAYSGGAVSGGGLIGGRKLSKKKLLQLMH